MIMILETVHEMCENANITDRHPTSKVSHLTFRAIFPFGIFDPDRLIKMIAMQANIDRLAHDEHFNSVTTESHLT